MITVAPLAARDAVAFGHLTFPLFRSQLAEAGTLAIGAACAGQPVGLALARAGREAELLSIAVAGPWRRRGVAGRLLAELEVRLAACGSERLSAVWIAGQPSTPAVERLLARRGFAPPQPRMLVCRARLARLAESPFVAGRRAPRRGRVVGWDELTAPQRDALRASTRDPARCPDWARPFFEEERIEAACSVALEDDGAVLGWMIAHRIAPDTVRYSRLYVLRGAAQGAGFALAAEAAWRQHSRLGNAAPFGSCDLAVSNRMMTNFLGRRLRPWLDSVTASKGASKALAPLPAAVGGR